jgi:hypothetical protein
MYMVAAVEGTALVLVRTTATTDCDLSIRL